MIDIDGQVFNTDICIQFSLLQAILFKLAQKDKQLQSKIDYLESKLEKRDEDFKKISEKVDVPISEIPEYEEPPELHTDFIKDNFQNFNQNFDNNNFQYNSQNFTLQSQQQQMNGNNNINNTNQNFNTNQNPNFNQNQNQNFNQNQNQNFNQNQNQNFNQNQNPNFNQNQNPNFNQNQNPNFNQNQNPNFNQNQNFLNNNNMNQGNNMIGGQQNYNNNFNINAIMSRIQQNEHNILELKNKLKNQKPIIQSTVNNNENDEELRKKIGDLEKELENIKVKIQDFNIYDMFKDSGDGNLDASKILISALENKVFKKFELVDERNKKMESDIFKNKQDIQNLTNNVNATKMMNDNMKNAMDENNQNIDNKINNLLEQIKNNSGGPIQIQTIQTQPEIKGNNGLSNEQVKKLLEQLKNELTEQINNLIDENNTKFKNILNEDSPLIQELQKKIQDLEKIIKLQLSSINAKQINNNFEKIDNDLKTKIGKDDIKEFLEKVRYLEEYSKDNELKFDTINDQNEKFKGELNSILRKIESLTGQFNQITTALQNDAISNKKSSPIIDLTRLVDNIRFNENNKLINQKFEQIKLFIDTIQSNIDDILQKLQRTPNDDDFNQYKNTLKSMIEEVKLYCSKRFADKIEIHKQIRLLDTQLKSITDTFNRKDNENWLIAKKPLNNFQCAACESYLNNLNNKSADYVPWNKYPQRDDKNYRMGHGFSRMLQMVNADILKTAEANRENLNKVYNSDDEKSEVREISSKMQKRKKQGSTLTIDANNIYRSEDNNNIYNNTGGIEDNGYQPHVVKIVKKNKGIYHDNGEVKDNLIEIGNDMNKGD